MDISRARLNLWVQQNWHNACVFLYFFLFEEAVQWQKNAWYGIILRSVYYVLPFKYLSFYKKSLMLTTAAFI